jgi:hypothetical protein
MNGSTSFRHHSDDGDRPRPAEDEIRGVERPDTDPDRPPASPPDGVSSLPESNDAVPPWSGAEGKRPPTDEEQTHITEPEDETNTGATDHGQRKGAQERGAKK